LFQAYKSYQLSKGIIGKKPTRTTDLNGSEVSTILVAYHYSGYKNFEYYYRRCILGEYADCFPDAPTYECFLSYIPKAVDLMYLWMLMTASLADKTGIYFIDSKKLEVCHLRRERSHKVFDGIAAKGKTSTGWFFGLKLHLIINNLGQIVSFGITPGNVADNNRGLLKRLLDGLSGICVGDKGYLTKLFDFFYENGLQLLTKPRKNMRKLPLDNRHNLMIDKRAVIESVFDILKTVCDIEHSRHRSPINALVHTISALVAYQYMEQKPKVFYPSIRQTLKKAA